MRTCTRVLLPFAFVGALVLMSQGAIQNFHASRTVTTVTGQEQTIPGGPIASQEAIKEIGENGGGPFNANSAHPFENPNPITNVLEIWMLLAIPFALTYTFGKMAGDQKQGWVVFATMAVLWLGMTLIIMPLEARGSPKLTAAGATQSLTADQSGGNMEGKETRFGPVACGLFASSTTGTSTGAINCQHDSLTPLGGAVPLVNMMYGEVSPGGTGSGLYGMLVFATPRGVHRRAHGRANAGVPRQEDPGRRDEAGGALHPLRAARDPGVHRHLGGVGLRAVSSLANDGPHGLTEITYAFTSQANNNGSAFGGLTGNTDWYNITGAISDARRPLHPDDPGAGHRRLARTQATSTGVGRHVPHRHAAVRRAALRRRDHRRRPHLLPGRRARPGGRAPRRQVLGAAP